MKLDKIKKELSQNEKKILLTLDKLEGKASPDTIFKKGNFEQKVEVMNAASWLQSKKLATLKEKVKTVYKLGKEGKNFLEKGFPEKRVLKLLTDKKGKVTFKELVETLDKTEISIAIGWLKKKNWADIKKENGEKILIITDKGKKACKQETQEEKILKKLKEKPNIQLEKNKVKPLLSRKDVIKEREIIISTITLTEKGKKIIEKGIEIEEEVSQLTSSIIKKGEWKDKKIRPYDIHAFAPDKYGGKPHPLVHLISKIKQIFLEMGFKEIEGNFTESCFWNMDALFIPQGHPARDLQDTFYCKSPSKIEIKDENFMDKIANIHEDGGITSSKGWGYSFSESESEKALLRTHTTVNTIRYLYNNPEPPAKVFSIGRVYRKENIDSTHLPEFYQIEGIVHEKNTNFKQLIGVLKEFYKRMGFEKVRFRPAYFPYTEPSMEVEVFWNNEWMELGGSGIFRPEVTEAIGIKNPVLAWGLGLERLAMLRFGLDDMRELYISDLEWVRKTSLI